MQYIRLRSRGSSLSFLQELLEKIGYGNPSPGYFGSETELAVKDFQAKSRLIVDGEIALKKWTLFVEKTKAAEEFKAIFLCGQDFIDFAKRYRLCPAAVKDVNVAESSGKGFLIDGRPKILFEGHTFWRQLKARGISPEDFANVSNETVFDKDFSNNHCLGGVREYERLEKAAMISTDPDFREAALSSASERNLVEASGLYILKNGCLVYMQSKNWVKFALCCNGLGYAKNKYGEKMVKAFMKYSIN
ncbi:N-acetylmuramidase domain-containing protein [Algoriphagus resistens]|uniref:N-acetylmuramidase domain-containing protein n=1 Tax=Algoriphagus resistens TaxID=1750590 RepID=UPI000716C775|nr:N-acetylmuramidase domain-containing protein [Algoriphagus resistens]